ncbi:MAG: serine acetyltransferase [Myxococcales bacterium]|nr:serine acetyltransferase [Myxococcales bacterium]
MNEHHPSAGDACDIGEIVEALCSAEVNLTEHVHSHHAGDPRPSRQIVERITETLRTVLFPGYFGSSEVRSQTLRFHVGHALDDVQRTLQQQIQRGLAFNRDMDAQARATQAREATTAFLARLPHVQCMLAEDVRGAFEGDPAARSIDEVIFCYPGLLAVFCHRIAHELAALDVPLLPRMISEHAHSVTGIDIHPGATIGHKFFIDHGTGVVIGETCIIGDRVRVYQGVTLGAKSFPLDAQGKPIKGITRHPIIEDDVIIYSGATILGRVTIGKGSVIGGNVWLMSSVPPGSRISIQAPKRETFEAGGGI